MIYFYFKFLHMILNILKTPITISNLPLDLIAK